MRANVAEVDQSLAVGDRNAKRVLRTRAFWAGLARLGEEFGIAGDGLVSFMSASVAARLEDEAFFAGLARLGKEFGIAGDGLVSFMSDGVAARLEDDAFWAGLARLGEFGIARDRLEDSYASTKVKEDIEVRRRLPAPPPSSLG